MSNIINIQSVRVIPSRIEHEASTYEGMEVQSVTPEKTLQLPNTSSNVSTWLYLIKRSIAVLFHRKQGYKEDVETVRVTSSVKDIIPEHHKKYVVNPVKLSKNVRLLQREQEVESIQKGEGAFGQVFTAFPQPSVVGSIYKLHVIKRQKITSNQVKKRIQQEVVLQNKAGILPVTDSVVKNKNHYMLMPYAGNSLKDLVSKHPLPDMSFFRAISHQIVEQVKQTNEKGILHCDIKPDNCMINQEGQLKLIDFGLAVKTGEAIKGGTYNFMAPEAVKRKVVSEKTDAWALGITLACLVLGKENIPFLYNSKGDIYTDRYVNLMHKLRHHQGTSPSLQDLFTKLLDLNSERRISAAEALQHPFFQAPRDYESMSIFELAAHHRTAFHALINLEQHQEVIDEHTDPQQRSDLEEAIRIEQHKLREIKHWMEIKELQNQIASYAGAIDAIEHHKRCIMNHAARREGGRLTLEEEQKIESLEQKKIVKLNILQGYKQNLQDKQS